MEGRGRRLTLWESTLSDHHVMRSTWMVFMHPIPMRHTQLFVCLLLLATKEWPHSESRSTPGPVETFYHCTSSIASILIALTKQGFPTGLNARNTKPTAYNGTQITLFRSFCGPITWQSASPGAQINHINSHWYVVDTPGPAIIGLPLCEMLDVVKMNCAVKVIQSAYQPLSPVPAAAASTTPKRTTSIKSTEDLIKEFSDRFQGRGQLASEYTIRLHDNAQPAIHALQKCPISICLKVKAELDKMVKLGIFTPVDEPKDWVSSVA